MDIRAVARDLARHVRVHLERTSIATRARNARLLDTLAPGSRQWFVCTITALRVTPQQPRCHVSAGCQCLALPVFRCGGGDDPLAAVHYCSPVCSSCDAQLVEQTMRAAREDARHQCCTVYYCLTHTYMHACVAQCADTAYTDAKHNLVCCLSGRVLVRAAEHHYGDGTVTVPHSSGHDNGETTAASSSSTALSRRSRPPRNRTGGGGGATTTTTTRELDERDGVHERIVFGDNVHENSFGQNVGARLSEYYESARRSVRAMILSPERAALEAEIREQVRANEMRALLLYVHETQREHANARKRARDTSSAAGGGGIVAYEVCVRVCLAQRNAVTTQCGPIAVPHGACARVLAYWSMLCVELRVQLAAVAEDVYSALRRRPSDGTTTPHLPEALDRLQRYDMHEYVPAFVQLLATGLDTCSGMPVVRADPLMGLLRPSTPVLVRLQHVYACLRPTGSASVTMVQNDIRELLKYAHDYQCTVPALTQLPLDFVLYANTNVIAHFLKARHQRFYAEPTLGRGGTAVTY